MPTRMCATADRQGVRHTIAYWRKMEPPELKQFYLATQSLREAMSHDLPLNDFDRISLENYIALLQITYMEWKQRNAKKPPDRHAA
jgi:hypothetical protein